MKKWKKIDERIILESKPFKILQSKYEKPFKEGTADAFILDCPDWVNIIGITNDNQILLIRQFRYGTNTIEWEVPGGVIEKGELPLYAAKREFEEETGYCSDEWEKIGVVNANPAIMNNKCYTFLAKNITQTGSINFDPDEMIESELVDEKQIKELIKNGKITNTYIIAAFYWYFNDYNQKNDEESAI